MTDSLITLIIHTRDGDLARRTGVYLEGMGLLVYTSSATELEQARTRFAPSVLLLDLRTDEARHSLAHWVAESPSGICIALGTARSDPALEAEDRGAYAVDDPELDATRFKQLVRRACDHLLLRAENQVLRENQRPVAAPAPAAASARAGRSGDTLTLTHFARAWRHFENVEAMMERIVEELTTAGMVVRAGIVARLRDDPNYRLYAGVHCPPEVSRLVYAPAAPVVRWLEQQGHLVARMSLDQVGDLTMRTLLRRTLDSLGAEIMLPLQARDRLMGWLLLGHRATGLPFTYADLEDFTAIAGQLASALENALLYEEVARQKALAENLLHALPSGVVAADENGVVRWFSVAAEHLLNLQASQVVGRPVEVLGSRMADQLRRAARGENQSFPEAWRDPLTRRSLVVQTRRLGSGAKGLGAVAVIQDLTAQHVLQEKQEQLERTAFWTELAASMSHEIRNPLVAIKTFAQLLPERYQDPEFRTSFSELVSAEVDRLNSIIDQINNFAHPPALKFHEVDIRDPIQRSIAMALPQGVRDGLHIQTRLAPDLPRVWGDDRALADCFARLLNNSVEALVGRADGSIDLEAVPSSEDKAVQITIRDNGPGVPPPLRDKIFSPFCTTKTRGMGLGLPIVKRTVVDHNGRVDMKSDNQGTAVTILLPATAMGDAK